MSKASRSDEGTPIPWGHYRQMRDDGSWEDIPMDPASAVLTSGYVLKKGSYPWGSRPDEEVCKHGYPTDEHHNSEGRCSRNPERFI